MSDSNLSHVQRLKLQQSEAAIVLIRLNDANGRPFYAYLKVKPDMVQRLNDDFAMKRTINLTEYGEVLKKAWGKDPDPETAAFMAKEYGYEDKPDSQE